MSEKRYVWILSPKMKKADIDILMKNASKNEATSEGLLSTYYIDGIIDFMEKNEVKVEFYDLDDELDWRLEIVLNDIEKIDVLLHFELGEYSTLALYPICDYSLWQCYQQADCESEFLKIFRSIEDVYEYVDEINHGNVSWHDIKFADLYRPSEEDPFVFIASSLDGGTLVHYYVVPDVSQAGS